MKITPVGKKIMIKPIKKEAETENKKGDIIVPDSAYKDPELIIGEIVKFGGEVKNIHNLQTGDIVYIAKFTGSEIIDDDKEKTQYLLVEQEDIIATENNK